MAVWYLGRTERESEREQDSADMQFFCLLQKSGDSLFSTR